MPGLDCAFAGWPTNNGTGPSGAREKGAIKLVNGALHTLHLSFQNQGKYLHIASDGKFTAQLDHGMHLQFGDCFISGSKSFKC